MAVGGKLFHQKHLFADTRNPEQQSLRFHGRAGLPLTDGQVITSLLTTGTVALVLSGLFAWSAHDLYRQTMTMGIRRDAAGISAVSVAAPPGAAAHARDAAAMKDTCGASKASR